MTKLIKVPVDMNGSRTTYGVYVSNYSKEDNNPIFFQSQWLSKAKNARVLEEVMESIQKLRKLAKENDVSFEDLCVYAINAAIEMNENNDYDDNI